MRVENHNNGFMRVYVERNHFIHFYHKDCFKKCPEAEIHDHPFNFTSEILTGSMVQPMYKAIIDDENGDRIRAYTKQVRFERADDHLYRLEVIDICEYKKGDVYRIIKFKDIHSVSSFEDGTVTRVILDEDSVHGNVVYMPEKMKYLLGGKEEGLNYLKTLGVKAE